MTGEPDPMTYNTLRDTERQLFEKMGSLSSGATPSTRTLCVREWYSANAALLKMFCRAAVLDNFDVADYPPPVEAIWAMARHSDSLGEGNLLPSVLDATKGTPDMPAGRRDDIGHGLVYVAAVRAGEIDDSKDALVTIAGAYEVSFRTAQNWWRDRNRYTAQVLPQPDAECAMREAAENFKWNRTQPSLASQRCGGKRREKKRKLGRAKGPPGG